MNAALLLAILLAQTTTQPADSAKAATKAAEPAGKAAEAAAAAAPPNPVTWAGTVALGLIALTGNSQTVTFATNAAFERKSPEWILGIKATAQYGQTTAAGADSSAVTALAAGVQARGDRRLSQLTSLYLLGGIEADHLKAVEARPFAEVGVSLLWFDEKVGDLQKQSFRTDLGFRYGREYRFQYYPTRIGPSDPAFAAVTIAAPRVGAFYRYAFNKDVIFSQEVSLLGNVIDGRLLFTSTSKLSSRLTERVGLGVSFVANDDTIPAKGKVPLDTALTVGLEIGL